MQEEHKEAEPPIPDDEFRLLIPVTLSQEEYAQLEENLIKETNPKESIVLLLWNSILIDGYDTYELCQKHNIPFRVVQKQFADSDEAKLFVINRHLAIPTYSAFVKIELATMRANILNLREAAKQRMVEASHPKKTNDDAFVNSQKQLPEKTTDDPPINVTREIAKQTNLGEQIVSRGIQLLKEESDAVKEKLRSGEITINKAYEEHNKRKKELEKIKAAGNKVNELMQEANKNIKSEKLVKNFSEEIEKFLGNMKSFFGQLGELNPEHLNLTFGKMQELCACTKEGCILIKAELGKRKLNPEPPAKAPDSPPTQLQETVQPEPASSHSTSDISGIETASQPPQDIISGLKQEEWSPSDGAWLRKKTESPTAENNNSEPATQQETSLDTPISGLTQKISKITFLNKKGEGAWKQDLKNWKELLNFDITYLEDGLPSVQPQKSIYATRCCKIKTDLPKAIPIKFYLEKTVQKPMQYWENHSFRYAIITDLYGIHFQDEEKENYDKHPSDLSEEEIKELGRIIKEKCAEEGIDTIYYYNSSPLMSVPYFKMLYYSGLKVFYSTKYEVADNTA